VYIRDGCFRKIDQRGGASYPRKDAGWAAEISLDLDMVSAICPHCKIVLVEADSNSFANLGAAENEAASLTPTAISSGDGGYGVEYPASSHYVTAVGGTSLTRASNSRGWAESAWSGAGSGLFGVQHDPVRGGESCAGLLVSP
jgi:subtilase family serine protease